MAQRQAKTENGESENDRRRLLQARQYAYELLGRALEENVYRSSVMPWPPEEHPLVMAELERVRDSLFVVPQARSSEPR